MTELDAGQWKELLEATKTDPAIRARSTYWFGRWRSTFDLPLVTLARYDKDYNRGALHGRLIRQRISGHRYGAEFSRKIGLIKP
jgi:hypothetical protein